MPIERIPAAEVFRRFGRTPQWLHRYAHKKHPLLERKLTRPTKCRTLAGAPNLYAVSDFSEIERMEKEERPHDWLTDNEAFAEFKVNVSAVRPADVALGYITRFGVRIKIKRGRVKDPIGRWQNVWLFDRSGLKAVEAHKKCGVHVDEANRRWIPERLVLEAYKNWTHGRLRGAVRSGRLLAKLERVFVKKNPHSKRNKGKVWVYLEEGEKSIQSEVAAARIPTPRAAGGQFSRRPRVPSPSTASTQAPVAPAPKKKRGRPADPEAAHRAHRELWDAWLKWRAPGRTKKDFADMRGTTLKAVEKARTCRCNRGRGGL